MKTVYIYGTVVKTYTSLDQICNYAILRSTANINTLEKTQRTFAFHFIEKIGVCLHPPRRQIHVLRECLYTYILVQSKHYKYTKIVLRSKTNASIHLFLFRLERKIYPLVPWHIGFSYLKHNLVMVPSSTRFHFPLRFLLRLH
jgi:hypothetical protein